MQRETRGIRQIPAPAPNVPVRMPNMGWEEALERFLHSLDVMDSSKKTYRESLNQYHKWLAETGRELSDLTQEDVLEFKRFLTGSGLQTLTVKSYIIAVHKFYQWTSVNRIYPDIASQVRAPRLFQGTTEGEHFMKMHLTDEQASSLLSYYRDRSLRDYAIINLMLRTGLRTIEVSRANRGDIKMKGGRRVLTLWGKGMDNHSDDVFVILTEPAWIPIRDYLQTRPSAGGKDPLFVTEGYGSNISKDRNGNEYVRQHSDGRMSTRLIQLIVKKGLREIGLDSHEYSAHSLRHTTACQLIKSGASLIDVQRVLRHSSPEITMIYLKSIEREERLKNATENLLDNAFSTDEQ